MRQLPPYNGPRYEPRELPAWTGIAFAVACFAFLLVLALIY
jgi:hypothetical protein